MEKHHSATDFKRQNMNFAKRNQNYLNKNYRDSICVPEICIFSIFVDDLIILIPRISRHNLEKKNET